jgi:hypothetical protein
MAASYCIELPGKRGVARFLLERRPRREAGSAPPIRALKAGYSALLRRSSLHRVMRVVHPDRRRIQREVRL